MKRLLLLGGGHAHVHVLAALAKAPLPGTQVMLVTPHARQVYSGMVPGLVAGHYREEQCVIALPPLAQAAGVAFTAATAVRLDAASRTVHLHDGRVAEYDLLSIDTGSEQPRDALPGAREHALFVRPMEHFVQLLPRLWQRAQQRVLDVAVIGAGAGGVELALAFQYRLGPQAHVALVTGGPPVLAAYPAAVQARAAAVLRRAGVSVLPAPCVALHAEHAELQGGMQVPCDVPVLATGGRAPGWLQGCGLALDEAGFVQVGATQQSTSHADVLAAGDVCSRVDAPHPRSGVYAVRAGPVLARNLRLLLAGQPAQPYRPKPRTLNLISCGRRQAIASWGDWSAQGRWVWWWKDHIDRAFIGRYSGAVPRG